MNVAILGMGRVGATLAAVLNSVGHSVVGVDPAGLRTFYEPGLQEALSGVATLTELPKAQSFDAYIICVGTPLIDDGALARAVESVAAHLPTTRKPATEPPLVVVRSTVRIGTTRTLVKPALDKANTPYHLAYCPERTVEGDALRELCALPQIVGVADDSSASLDASSLASQLFHFACATYPLDSFEDAEFAKLLANSWRDTTLAYANQVAILGEQYGLNARAAIKAANWNYPRCLIPLPGPVGGPCLVKDTYLLPRLRGALHPNLIETARAINERVILEICDNILDIAADLKMHEPRMAILGTAFKGTPPTDDTRDAPSGYIADCLRERGCRITTIDPLAPADSTTLDHHAFDIIVAVTFNTQYWYSLRLRDHLTPNGFIYDCCGVLHDADFVFGG
jgi:nucleotide sugar dehydrogenase